MISSTSRSDEATINQIHHRISTFVPDQWVLKNQPLQDKDIAGCTHRWFKRSNVTLKTEPRGSMVRMDPPIGIASSLVSIPTPLRKGLLVSNSDFPCDDFQFASHPRGRPESGRTGRATMKSERRQE